MITIESDSGILSKAFIFIIISIIVYLIFFHKPDYADWPTTTAVIEETEIPKVFKIPPSIQSNKKSTKHYALYVKYNYSINDNPYSSNQRIEFFSTLSRDKAIQDELTPGSSITIYYNPENPNETHYSYVAPSFRD